MENFYTKIGWVALGSTIFCKPLMLAALFGMAPCFLRTNVKWNVQAQHVAITRDGIRFVRDKRQTCWGSKCTDAGKTSKTGTFVAPPGLVPFTSSHNNRYALPFAVPFDKITDCDVAEPAGNSCLCIENVLSTVNIDTASSGHGRHELQICGLKDPHSFKKLVWAMKRNSGCTRALLDSIPQALEKKKGNNDQVASAANVSTLLREIRDELRKHNTLLQQIQPALPSAPVDQGVA